MSARHTKYLKVDPANIPSETLEEAGRIITGGGLVAFPTETVYGLGANALDVKAVKGIFEAKGRPSDNPLIVHISDISQVYDLALDITVPAQRVMEAFWPGPLTIVLPKKPVVPYEVTGGLETVAIRMPDHPVALGLISAAGVPVAAPSANSSGKPSPTMADHVLEDLNGKIDMVLDGGPCRVGVESTVLDMTTETPLILRPGGLTREDLESILGHIGADAAVDSGPKAAAPKAPGMKYAHYSPKAEVIVVTGEDFRSIFNKITDLILEYRLKNRKIGVLASRETARGYSADAVFTVGARALPETVAQNLFFGLRSLDNEGVDLIIAEGYPETGIGEAIMNRLKKAAGNNIIRC